MQLTPQEAAFLTALTREQAQTGCRGPAHDLLRQHAFPDAPRSGRGSLAFSYEVVPLITMLLKDQHDLLELDNFLRAGERDACPAWPWASADEFQRRLKAARLESGSGAVGENRSQLSHARR
jgi:hypothetical protein